MAAKETKDIERVDEKIAFHEGFAETQDLANYLATEFNQRLRGIPGFDPITTPRLTFLSCSVLLLRDPNWATELRGVLVEKMLDTERFPWTKWNDNDGIVNGIRRKHASLDLDYELKELQNEKAVQDLGAILEEGDSDTDDDEEEEEEEEEEEDDRTSSARFDNADSSVNASDYLQAFTHFTYRYTNRKVMVCDLQGIYNTELIPPAFELTDLAMHYSSSRRRGAFGWCSGAPIRAVRV